MKKRIISLIIFMCLLIIIPTSIWAVTGGGTGDSGSGGGTGGSGTVANTFYYQFGGPDAIRTGAYKYELAYFNKDGSREILSTVIAQGDTYLSYGNSGIIIQRVKEYYEYLKGRNSNVHYTTSGELVNLANQIENGYAVSGLFPGMTVESAEWILNVILDSNTGFGMSETDMQREQDQNPGTIDSYGYRILIQKIQLYGVGGSYTNSFAAPRKEVASDMISNGGVYSRIGRCVQLFGRQTGYARELYTEQNDVHIKNGTNSKGNIGRYSDGSSFVRWCNNNGIGFSWGSSEDKTSALADWQDGLGYNILWFTTDPFVDFDYSVDMAYTDCDNTDPENVAYVIKDTSSWGAILNSGSSDNGNVQGYFNKGEEGHGDVFCRDEFTIYFPNAKDQIYVDPGRYFTINPSPDSWTDFSKIINKFSSGSSASNKFSSGSGASTIPLLKPVKVKKKQECQANVNLEQEENESDEAFAAKVHQAKMAALSSYLSSNESSFKNNMGTVYFRYNETYKESKYNMNNPESFREFDKSHQEYSSNLDDAAEMLTMEATSSYELPDNYYQYIRIRDGLSMKTKPSNANTEYKNVGIENLPVSFENHGTPITTTVSKAADIQFAYDLPTSGTNISQAAGDDNFLATEDPGDNIYKQYLSGNYDEDVKKQLENSVCAQMYGFGTANFNSCAQDRVTDKSPSGGNCISKSSIMGSTTSGYSCMVLTSHDPDDEDGCNSEEDADRYGVDWNPIAQVCCPEGTTFNPELGKCSPNGGPGDNTCRIENGKYYDFNGNEITKEEYDRICPGPGDSGDNTCRIENGKYYDFNGNEITKEEYDKICPSDVPPVCPEDECPYGCCPSGECAPMPDGTCPGQGGIDVIYRTIDLEDPFPGQDAENRATGANWCSYNIKTQKIDCKYNNATSNNYIIRERSGHKYGSDVYDENHILYEITLDTETIKQIRDYNDANKYDDDWIRACYQNGKACFSKFLRDEGNIYSKLSGECKLISGSNFYDCDEPV